MAWLRHSRVTRDGYVVNIRQGFREEAWVEYEENGRTLTLDAEWSMGKDLDLLIRVPEQVYFPPDYKASLSESRMEEIRGRISDALNEMKIAHHFLRLGWTSFS